MNNKFVILVLIALFLSISVVSANELDNATITSINDDGSLEVMEDTWYQNNIDELKAPQESSQEILVTEDNGDVIIVNDWDELQYYCAQTDKDYTLKLKENTNFYPDDPNDANYQIKVKNNVKIYGSDGAYIGDNSSNPRDIHFVGMIVEDNSEVGLTLENITFKYIKCIYSLKSMDGIFIQMGGRKTNVIKNCNFSDIKVSSGHATIVYLKRGSTILDNCNFINCTSNYGVVSVYDPNSVKTVSMVVRNCYFENNYAETEPGCINNCGKLTVYNSTFIKNRSFWWAGAIHTHNNGNTTIHDSKFIDNLAGWNGGALYTYSYLQIYNSVFIGNNCTTNNGGGAIGACQYQSNPHIYIEKCLFENNTNNCWALDELSTSGTGRGGAISLMDIGSIEVRDTTFIANAASIGTAICAIAVDGYGSPDIIIVNNSFIDHTRMGDVLNVRVDGTLLNISNNQYYGNSIELSSLTLTKRSVGKDSAMFEVNVKLTNPNYYDSDILDKTSYDVYVNNVYVKTVNSKIFSVDFDDLDICSVYVIPTISNKKSNELTVTSTREYIFVSKNKGNDNNNGITRDKPVSTISKALELAKNCQNIILLDGDYSEVNIQVDYDVTIKGENGATLSNATSFIINGNSFTLKNLNINNLNTDTFIKQNNGDLVISNCVFENNSVSNIFDAKNTNISKSIFTNNDGVIVYNGGVVNIVNSILLNNSQVIAGNTSNINLDYNWWGNSIPDLNLNHVLTLNITCDKDSLENNQKSNVRFGFYLNDSKYVGLPEINLILDAVNGVSSENVTSINSNVVYTLTAFEDGILTVRYNDFSLNKEFVFLKSNPNIGVVAKDVMFFEDVTVQVNLPKDASGNLTVTVGDKTQNIVIDNTDLALTFKDLTPDSYTVSVDYSGDRKYSPQIIYATVNVNKYESVTNLNIGNIEVGEDLTLTVATNAGTTGNVTLSINDEEIVLNLNNSIATHVIKNIKRGDYVIKAVYNGDGNYKESMASKFIEVDNLNATMNIKVDDITYGEFAVVMVNLNNDASGRVIVTVDGIVNSSDVVDGSCEVKIYGVDAGENKNLSIFYTGDNTYFNLTKNATFTVNKADLVFNISSIDIKIGQNGEINIQVPQKTVGTFTIGDDVVNIPLSGVVSYVISDLEIGNYTYTATYNGNNYHTISKSTSFEVSDYPKAIWPNSGANTQNTQKSDYDTNVNGNVLFTIPVNETIVDDIVIDSLGNIYFNTQSGIYGFNKTNQLWYFTSTAAEGNLSGITISRDVIITPKSGDTLYFINQTSGERWGESNIYQGSSFFAPVVTSDATLYIVSEYQYTSEDYKLTIIPYKLWANGGDPTLVTIGNTKPLCSPTLNENIIVIISDNRLRLIDAKTLDTISIKSGNFQSTRPVIGEGNIVYSILSNTIVAYNSAGAQVWKTRVTGGVGTTLALDNEQGLYHVNEKGVLYKYDLIDGSESKFSDLKVTSGILIGNDGNLYFGSNNMFYALDSEGNVLWKSDLGSKIMGNPVMDSSGLIYVPTENSITALTYAPLRNAINVTVVDIFVGQTAEVKITADTQIVNKFTYAINGETFTSDAGTITKTLSGLASGNYTVEVSYAGDARFASQNDVFTFEVKKLTPELTVSAENINVGETLVIKIDTDATGVIYSVINGGNYTAKDNIISIPNLKADNYTTSVVFVGDNKYKGVAKELNFTVFKVSVSLDDALSVSDDNATFTVKLAGDATGSLTVSVDNVKYSENVKDGSAEVVIPKLSEGLHDIQITYSGDEKYLSTSKSMVLVGEKVIPEDNTTNPIENTTNSTPGNETGGDNNSTAGNNTGNTTVPSVNVSDDAFSIPENGSYYSISLPSDATGTLTVTVDGVSYSQELVNGKASVTIPELGEGSHNITVVYSGDSKYASTSKSSVVVTPGNSTGNNTGNVTEGNNSGNTTPYINVPDEAFTVPDLGNEYSISLPSDATGTLTVTVDGVSYSQELVNGKASVTIPELGEGSHNITVTYSGDSKYASSSKSSVVVKEHVPVLKLSASNLSMLYTSGKYFKVRLTSDGKPLTNQKVKITINGKTYTKTTDKNGYASMKISLAPKAYAVKAVYGDVKISKKVTVKSIIQAKNINAKKSSKSIKIKVTLKKVNNKYLKNKKVTFKFNKKTFKAKTNKKGVVTFTIKNNVYNKLKANKKYTYQVIYSKDKVKKTIKFKK